MVDLDFLCDIHYIITVMGASYSGSTLVSKTNCVGSIPTAPAEAAHH